MTSLMAISANVNSAHISHDPGGLAPGVPQRNENQKDHPNG
jgi:hypothetical protein